jgi:hypothetical protein
MNATGADMGEPTLRTKTCLLPKPIDDEYLEIIQRLHRGDLSAEDYLAETIAFFSPKIEGGELTSLISDAFSGSEQLELVRRHIDDRRYTILFYGVEKGEVHPPHHHFNVMSTQIIVRGKVRLREYDRVNRTHSGSLRLRLVNDTTLKVGDVFQASEWNRNVHWFQAVDGPALIFNTNARGFEEKTFDFEEGGFGRRYIDPTNFTLDGLIEAAEFDHEQAMQRFGGKSLDEFPVPADSI